MAPEPSNYTAFMFHEFWNYSIHLTETRFWTYQNTADVTNTSWYSANIGQRVTLSVDALISVFGMVGNGTVIWLLGFCVKRNPYSVYILNLAIADFLYLLANVFDVITVSTVYLPHFSGISNNLMISSYPVGLTLLMAISAERCVSVLWPLWYKCHRPTHLSTIVCALIWGLFLIYFLLGIACSYSWVFYWMILVDISYTMSLPTLLVLFVSSMILVIWGQCCSQRRQPSKLYWTILLNVLAVLLLNVPRGIYLVCYGHDFYQVYTWHTMFILSAVNSAVNPVIYFFVGRYGKQRGKNSLQEVLQSALTEEESGPEQRRGINNSKQNMMTPEHQGGGPTPSPQV